MKKFGGIFFSIILILVILGIVSYMVDTTRVNNGEEPIFTFLHKIIDGVDYSAKVDVGLGYKIIKYDIYDEEIVKIGTIFMEETPPYIENPYIEENISGESGEEPVKLTTFGEKHKHTIYIEGFEEEVDVKDINSKLGYSMDYYYDLFEYSGFEDHDVYLWYLSSGEDKSTITVYDISNEEIYKESLENIEKDDLLEEISGEQPLSVKKVFCKIFEEDEISKVNYVYLMEIDALKLMIDLRYKQEAEEGLGVYMHSMTKTIREQNLNKD